MALIRLAWFRAVSYMGFAAAVWLCAVLVLFVRCARFCVGLLSRVGFGWLCVLLVLVWCASVLVFGLVSRICDFTGACGVDLL